MFVCSSCFLLAADHLKKHPLKMMSTLTIALNHSKEEEENEKREIPLKTLNHSLTQEQLSGGRKEVQRYI